MLNPKGRIVFLWFITPLIVVALVSNAFAGKCDIFGWDHLTYEANVIPHKTGYCTYFMRGKATEDGHYCPEVIRHTLDYNGGDWQVSVLEPNCILRLEPTRPGTWTPGVVCLDGGRIESWPSTDSK